MVVCIELTDEEVNALQDVIELWTNLLSVLDLQRNPTLKDTLAAIERVGLKIGMEMEEDE